jgi:hypothetical protein
MTYVTKVFEQPLRGYMHKTTKAGEDHLGDVLQKVDFREPL